MYRFNIDSELARVYFFNRIVGSPSLGVDTGKKNGIFFKLSKMNLIKERLKSLSLKNLRKAVFSVMEAHKAFSSHDT